MATQPLPPHVSGPGYITLGTIPIYELFLRLVSVLGLVNVLHVVISRWSKNDQVGAAEQASKVLGIHARLVPAVRKALDTIPEAAWLSKEGRAEHKILEVRVRDVTPHRYPDDPSGNELIGYLVVVDDAAILRVASSGFKSILKEDGEELNPYSQTVIELVKWAASTCPGERVQLRLSDDRTRKGRLAVELGRIDRWLERLKVRLFFGPNELALEGFGKLMSSGGNSENEQHRVTTINNLTVGILAGVKKGFVPASEANLPPYFRHVEDSDATGLDRRLRDGDHLVTEWDVRVFPALWEYVPAFGDGASPEKLNLILCKYHVPTPKQLPPKNGKTRYSTFRDSTFDQLPKREGQVRAARWLTYSDLPVRAVPAGASDDQRARTEAANLLALRKFEVLRSARFTYTYSNPTPTQDQFGEWDVVRDGVLDPGHVGDVIKFTWPDKRKTAVRDGIVVVTDELDLDEHGEPQAWENLGLEVADIDKCVRRLRDRAVEGRQPSPTWTTLARLLRIKRWATVDPETREARQWEMWQMGQKGKRGTWRYRRLLWRPAPDQENPTANLNLDWEKDRTGARRQEGTAPDQQGPAANSDLGWGKDGEGPDVQEGTSKTGRHAATFREGKLLRWAYTALRDAVLVALDAGTALELSERGVGSTERDTRGERLLAGAVAAEEAARSARLAAKGYTITAMEARGGGDEEKYYELSNQATAKSREAEEKERDAARARASISALTGTVGAELPARTVAELLDVMRRCADDNDGCGPAAAVSLVAGLFDDWVFTPGKPDVRVSCTARLPLVGGRVVVLRLKGTLRDTGYGQPDKEPYEERVITELLRGRTLDDLVGGCDIPTSRDALYCHARRALKAAGFSTYRIQALLDHPFPAAIQAAWAARTGERPASKTWTDGFEKHMGDSYSTDTWGKSACPTSHMAEMHRVMAAVRQHPEAWDINDLIVSAGVRRKRVLDMINPPIGAPTSRQRPKMLRWVEGQTGRRVQAIPCPHKDCPAPPGRRWATVANLLPETCPEPGGVGGVLCEVCSRLPRAELSRVFFPLEWHTPVARLVEGVQGSLRTQRLTGPIEIGAVANINRRPRVSAKELAGEFNLTQRAVKDALRTGQVAAQYHGRGGPQRAATYEAAPARRVVKAALSDASWDAAARRPDACQLSAACRRTGLSAAEMREAVGNGLLPAHRTGNRHLHFLPEDLDLFMDVRAQA